MRPLEIGQAVRVSPSIGQSFEGTVERLKMHEVIVRSSSGKRRAHPYDRVRPLEERRSLGPGVDVEAMREIAQRGTRERPELAAVPQFERGADEAYLAHVRQHPCMTPTCPAPAPSEAHHWAPRGSIGAGGLGIKADDRRTVPLCRRCHQHWHDHGALPDMSRAMSRAWMARVQSDLLIEWIRAMESK